MVSSLTEYNTKVSHCIRVFRPVIKTIRHLFKVLWNAFQNVLQSLPQAHFIKFCCFHFIKLCYMTISEHICISFGKFWTYNNRNTAVILIFYLYSERHHSAGSTSSSASFTHSSQSPTTVIPSRLPNSPSQTEFREQKFQFADEGAHWYRASAVLLRFHK